MSRLTGRLIGDQNHACHAQKDLNNKTPAAPPDTHVRANIVYPILSSNCQKAKPRFSRVIIYFSHIVACIYRIINWWRFFNLFFSFSESRPSPFPFHNENTSSCREKDQGGGELARVLELAAMALAWFRLVTRAEPRHKNEYWHYKRQKSKGPHDHTNTRV